MSQLISLEDGVEAHGCLQRSTTTVSDFAGMKPSKNTFFVPQL
jgi:hypothetical protein